ncbi:SUMF1/EgtB/PvdO family nonheme iron enzyme [Sulfidibacter corallicola]
MQNGQEQMAQKLDEIHSKIELLLSGSREFPQLEHIPDGTPTTEAAHTETKPLRCEPNLSWLHLSDFQFGESPDWRQEKVLADLARDVIEPLKNDRGLPRWVCLTGDIADKGRPEEYDTATQTLNRLAEHLGQDPVTDWFLVPGNHDVYRPDIGKRLRRERDGLDVSDVNLILEDPEEIERYAKRQKAFCQFTESWLGEDRKFRTERPWTVEIQTLGDLTIAFLCLNSAWASQDKQDQFHLALGDYQLSQALAEADRAGAHIKVALHHHPLEDLMKDDAETAEARLKGPGGCHFVLHGHVLKPRFRKVALPDSDCFESAAGACRVAAGRTCSVNYMAIDPVTRVIYFKAWAYNPDRGFWYAANDLFRGVEGACTWPIPESWNLPLFRQPQSGIDDTTCKDQPTRPFHIPKSYQKKMLMKFRDLHAQLTRDKAGKLSLEEVFVSLETAWQEPVTENQAGKRQEQAEGPERGEPQTRSCESLCEHEAFRHFVLAGDPGSGKTTLLRFLVVSRLTPKSELMPILLPLAEFQNWLQPHPGHHGGLLLEWAAEVYGENGVDAAFLDTYAGQGRILWLLDGFDEIFDESSRLRAAKIIGNWVSSVQGHGDRLLLTSRPHALESSLVLTKLALPDTQASILPLSKPLQNIFLSNWFLGLFGKNREEEAEARQGQLSGILEDREGLGPFRENPMLLSILAILYYNGDELPDRRADLYERAVEVLLSQRFGANASGGSSDKVRQITRALSRVARNLMEAGKGKEIGERQFREWFAVGYGKGKSGAQEDLSGVIRELGNHSGLLKLSGAVHPRYAFAHLTFQEFLAARSYANDPQPSISLRDRLEEGAWREVILLTAGCLFGPGPEYHGPNFIRELFAECDRGEHCGQILSLAMEAMAEAPSHMDLSGEIERAKKQALSILQDRETTASEKVRDSLGLSLGRLGDPRLGFEKPERWVWIPPGRFTMGRDDGLDHEKPAHEVMVEHGFFLAKYPVTNQEYGEFMREKGYQNKHWWSPLGLRWLEERGEDISEPRHWKTSRFGKPNQPVVGISWFEAEAYCNWLSAHLASAPPQGWQGLLEVRLPSEIEWEYATRGRESHSYPWGEDEPDDRLANFGMNLGRSSAVGVYPKGGTPSGLLDMGGNVWEWCRTRFEKKAYGMPWEARHRLIIEKINHVACVRGGSWLNRDWELPAAYRIWFTAGNRVFLVGFRCCCVAVPSAEP